MHEAPEPGAAVELEPGLRRILAPNASPMTHWGTNTYLLGGARLAVVDPGPADERHLEAILAAASGARITHIFVTHAHLDHSPLARKLGALAGAPVLAFGDAATGRSEVMRRLADRGLAGGGEGVDRDFAPDRALADGAVVDGGEWALEALWTPGHFGNHMCLRWGDAVFTGDLVMGWASSLVSPPDGDLSDFRQSCRRIAALGARVLHPGHGAPVEAPSDRVAWLLGHRAAREEQILAALERHGAATPAALAATLYTDVPAHLHAAAARNVFAHLVDLSLREQVSASPALSPEATYSLR